MKKINFLIITLFVLFLAACGGSANGEDSNRQPFVNEDNMDTNEEQETKDSQQNDTDGKNNNDETTDNEKDVNNESDETGKENGNKDGEADDKTTEIGIYNGQADPHTIEIETEDGPTAFQLTNEARGDVEKLTVGEEVIYTYYINGEQLVIELIEPYEQYKSNGQGHHHMNEKHHQNRVQMYERHRKHHEHMSRNR